MAFPHERRTRSLLAKIRPLPFRRQRHASRHRAPTRTPRHRPLFRRLPPPPHMSIVEKFVTMDYGPAPEDPREALAWLDRHKRRFGHFINGTFQAPRETKY